MRPELVEATELMRTDDPERIDSALRLLQNTVYSFSMKVCGHREDAEDTMQFVLQQSLPYLQTIEDPQALAVWLYKVTRNHCGLMRRKSKFAPERMLTLDELKPSEGDLEHLLESRELDPEASVLQGERDEQLQQAILRIPPKYRLVLVLHDMEELDTAEIARITGLTVGTVRIRLHRARLFVRKELTVPTSAVAKPKRRRRVGRLAGRQAAAECNEVFAQLSEYLDGRLDDVSCDDLKRHIEECRPCVSFIRDLEGTIARCRSLTVPCSEQTTGALRRMLTEEYLRLLQKAAAKVC